MFVCFSTNTGLQLKISIECPIVVGFGLRNERTTANFISFTIHVGEEVVCVYLYQIVLLRAQTCILLLNQTSCIVFL